MKLSNYIVETKYNAMSRLLNSIVERKSFNVQSKSSPTVIPYFDTLHSLGSVRVNSSEDKCTSAGMHSRFPGGRPPYYKCK